MVISCYTSVKKKQGNDQKANKKPINFFYTLVFSTRSTSTGKCCCETEGASGMFSAGEGRGASRLQYSVISLDRKNNKIVAWFKYYLTLEKRTKGREEWIIKHEYKEPTMRERVLLNNSHDVIKVNEPIRLCE